MTSGTFTVGETINGTMPGSVTTQQIGSSSLPEIVFRAAAANHKYGVSLNLLTFMIAIHTPEQIVCQLHILEHLLL